MKKKSVCAFVVVGLVCLVVWFAFTLRINLVLKIDGMPCRGCALEVVDLDSMEESEFPLDADGRIRLPKTMCDTNMLCSIKRDGEKLKSMFSTGFRRGTTTVDFRPKSLHTEYEYRFLLYGKHEESETWSGESSP